MSTTLQQGSSSYLEYLYTVLCLHLESKPSSCNLKELTRMMQFTRPSFSEEAFLAVFQKKTTHRSKECLHEEILAAAYMDIVAHSEKDAQVCISESETLARLHKNLMPQWRYFVWINTSDNGNALFESEVGIFQNFFRNSKAYKVRIPSDTQKERWFLRDA